MEQLGRHLLRGRSLVRDVVEELHPDPMRMGAELAAPQNRQDGNRVIIAGQGSCRTA